MIIMILTPTNCPSLACPRGRDPLVVPGTILFPPDEVFESLATKCSYVPATSTVTEPGFSSELEARSLEKPDSCFELAVVIWFEEDKEKAWSLRVPHCWSISVDTRYYLGYETQHELCHPFSPQNGVIPAFNVLGSALSPGSWFILKRNRDADWNQELQYQAIDFCTLACSFVRMDANDFSKFTIRFAFYDRIPLDIHAGDLDPVYAPL